MNSRVDLDGLDIHEVYLRLEWVVDLPSWYLPHRSVSVPYLPYLKRPSVLESVSLVLTSGNFHPRGRVRDCLTLTLPLPAPCRQTVLFPFDRIAPHRSYAGPLRKPHPFLPILTPPGLPISALLQVPSRSGDHQLRVFIHVRQDHDFDLCLQLCNWHAKSPTGICHRSRPPAKPKVSDINCGTLST